MGRVKRVVCTIRAIAVGSTFLLGLVALGAHISHNVEQDLENDRKACRADGGTPIERISLSGPMRDSGGQWIECRWK
jgi:hypothetical protein